MEAIREDFNGERSENTDLTERGTVLEVRKQRMINQPPQGEATETRKVLGLMQASKIGTLKTSDHSYKR